MIYEERIEANICVLKKYLFVQTSGEFLKITVEATGKIIEKAVWRSVFLTIQRWMLNAYSTGIHFFVVSFYCFLPVVSIRMLCVPARKHGEIL